MIRIKDKSFEASIPNEEIQQKVKALAEKMNKDYAGKNPVFVCILNGYGLYEKTYRTNEISG